MEILNNVTSGVILRPDRGVLYGVDGIGKSKFFSYVKNALWVCAEDGTNHLDITRAPVTTYPDIMALLGELYEEEHPYTSLILDPIGWIEGAIKDAIEKEYHVNSLEEIPYGKGKYFVRDEFKKLLGGLSALYDERDMNIYIVGHVDITRFEDPQHDNYDRYTIALDKANADKLRQWADFVLFANYQVAITKEDAGFGRQKTKAKGGSDRVIFSQRTAAYDAKTRYSIPDKMPLDSTKFFKLYNAAKAKNQEEK